MARPFHLITLAPYLAESRIVGTGVRAPAAALRVEREGASEGLPFPLHALQQLLEDHGPSRLPMAVVLPSKAVTFRRIEFPFDRPRQVAEALKFELENELLGELELYVHTHRQFRNAAGGTTVLVYLLERAVMDALAAVSEARGPAPMRITFSASALYLSTPLLSPLHYQVYAGAEETFISLIRDNRLHSVRTFPFEPIVPILTATERKIVTARDFMTLLDRRQSRPARGGTAEGAPDEPENRQHPAGGVDRRQRRSGSEQELFLNRFREQLEGVLPDINHFVRLQSLGEPITLTLHGMFAPFLEWDAEQSQVRLGAQPAERPSQPRDSLGIIEELSGHPEEFRSSGLIQFAERREGWRERLGEWRRPLQALGALAAVLLILLVTNFFLALDTMQTRAGEAEQAIAAALRERVPPGTTAANGMAILRERVALLEAEAAEAEAFGARSYDVMDLLKELSEVFASRDGVTVEGLTYNSERFSLAGTTPSYNDSESLRTALVELPRFQRGKATLTHQRTRQGITYRIAIEKQP